MTKFVAYREEGARCGAGQYVNHR